MSKKKKRTKRGSKRPSVAPGTSAPAAAKPLSAASSLRTDALERDAAAAAASVRASRPRLDETPLPTPLPGLGAYHDSVSRLTPVPVALPKAATPTPAATPAATPATAPAATPVAAERTAAVSVAPPATALDPSPRRRRADTSMGQFARRAIPRGAFVRGAMIGLVVGLPATAGIAFLLSFLEISGDPTAPFERVIAFASVFAGLPALISAGGIGRLAARASAAGGARPVAAAIFAAVLPFAAVGAGLAILTIVPLGALPATPADWALTAGAGAVAGIVAGAVLGLWIGTSPAHDL